ncbi:class I SAM-dependent methyltransferase [Amycolatopsis nigrescens]|uniref:class I SAM-dependent methyltransferase n=1 Tax=Amycolatopsis nigrescens TaxID=381445 RepID=UPI0003700FC9|nr:class I SAM-dependent methyltransferase [Amycolatopsis nigrescens]
MTAECTGPGSRHDPHAQARHARQSPLLLHSLSVFREIFELLFEHREIGTVVEVGVESGEVSALYLELGATTVHCVEPSPSPDLRTAIAEREGLHLVETPSPAALTALPAAELYILDGDHNYATVKHELDWILRHAPNTLVVLHDLLWPCSRRDLYYQPSPLPPPHRHPASTDGPTVWHDELTPAGFTGLGSFTSARHAGGERNGVLTAVEDALDDATNPSWRLLLIPAIFGAGVLFRPQNPADEQLLRKLELYQNSHLLAAMENNRIALYTRVLQLQYEAAARDSHLDALADQVAHYRAELERLKTGPVS